MKKCIYTLGLFFLTYNSYGQLSFTQITGTSLPPLVDGQAVFGDFDNDNDLDLLITGAGVSLMPMSNTPVTALYKNDGVGNFSSSPLAIDSLSSSSISIGDIDNDSDLDILINGENSSMTYVTKIYSNNGSGVFSLTSNNIIGTIQGDTEFGDIDGDNDLDFIISGYTNSGYNTSLYRNDGTGSFSLVSGTTFSGTNYASVKFIDIEKDNDLDVLIAGTNGSSTFTELYTNNGSGTYSIVASTPFSGSNIGMIDIADIDNDSDDDIFITGFDGSTEFSKLYTNNGNGTFTLNTSSVFTGLAYSYCQFSDLDIDGDKDVIITGYNGTTTSRQSLVYLNNGSGVFTLETSINFDGAQQFRNIAADIDGDTDPDFYLSGSSDGGGPDKAIFYKNNITALSIVEKHLSNVEVYPNPTNDQLTIKPISPSHKLTINIITLQGKLISNKSYQNIDQIQLTIDQPSGIYILNIHDELENTNSTIKVIKN